VRNVDFAGGAAAAVLLEGIHSAINNTSRSWSCLFASLDLCAPFADSDVLVMHDWSLAAKRSQYWAAVSD
jgi:hypothetical protein